MLPRMLLNGRGLRDSFQVIQMEVAGRDLIRSFSSEFQIDCDLEQDVDACQVFDSETALLEELGIFGRWKMLRDVMLPLFGIETFEFHNNSSDDGRQKKFAVISRRCCDTFSAHKFVHGLFERAHAHGQ